METEKRDRTEAWGPAPETVRKWDTDWAAKCAKVIADPSHGRISPPDVSAKDRIEVELPS
jgi:hypothetical protein